VSAGSRSASPMFTCCETRAVHYTRDVLKAACRWSQENIWWSAPRALCRHVQSNPPHRTDTKRTASGTRARRLRDELTPASVTPESLYGLYEPPQIVCRPTGRQPQSAPNEDMNKKEWSHLLLSMASKHHRWMQWSINPPLKRPRWWRNRSRLLSAECAECRGRGVERGRLRPISTDSPIDHSAQLLCPSVQWLV